jgi:hypothetical protein
MESDLATDAFSPRAYDALDRLRDTLIPAAFADAGGAEALVTGGTAMTADYFAAVDDVTPWVFVFVLGLSFVLLAVVFRSIVVPAKAILMNLLSVGAAYGLLVLVFQKGYGADLLGFQRAYSIEAWLPIFLFCILFGLSMDYHVFLLSRIREHYDQTSRNGESVAVGLRATAKIIRRGSDHGGGLRRVRVRAARPAPGDGVWARGSRLPGRDARPLDSGPERDGAARRPQLVSPSVAPLAAGPPDRGAAGVVAVGRGRKGRAQCTRAWHRCMCR